MFAERIGLEFAREIEPRFVEGVHRSAGERCERIGFELALKKPPIVESAHEIGSDLSILISGDTYAHSVRKDDMRETPSSESIELGSFCRTGHLSCSLP